MQSPGNPVANLGLMVLPWSFQDINMTDNPLGALGMRSLLRLLSRKENALKHFQSDGCHLARNMPVWQGRSRNICRYDILKLCWNLSSRHFLLLPYLSFGAIALRFAGGTNVNHWYWYPSFVEGRLFGTV